MIRCCLLGCAALLIAAILPAQGMSIAGALPGEQSAYDRFVLGTYPGDVTQPPSANPEFIGKAFDLSGVGWDATLPSRSITLISPQYFICAAHYAPGGTLVFQSRLGALRSYSVDPAGFRALTYLGSDGLQTSDVLLGRLTAPISQADEVSYLPILYLGYTDVADPLSFTPYFGTSLLNYAGSRFGVAGEFITVRLGTNTLSTIEEFGFGETNTNIGFFYDQGAEPGETRLEPGDSGSPTFGWKDGAFGLLGIHAGIDEHTSADSFLSYGSYITQINQQLSSSNQSLMLVPEPSVAALILAALVAIILQRRRPLRE